MVSVSLDDRELTLDQEKFELLDAINRTGSIASASVYLGISYRTAVNWLKEIERVAGDKPVKSKRGGREKGSTSLTELGLKLLEAYYAARSIHRPGFTKTYIETRLSARNLLRGIVTNTTESSLVSLVNVQLDERQEVKAIITTESLKRLGIKTGDHVFVILKATEVMLMKI